MYAPLPSSPLSPYSPPHSQVHYFSLNDLNARGYVRQYALSYISSSSRLYFVTCHHKSATWPFVQSVVDQYLAWVDQRSGAVFFWLFLNDWDVTAILYMHSSCAAQHSAKDIRACTLLLLQRSHCLIYKNPTNQCLLWTLGLKIFKYHPFVWMEIGDY